MTGVHTAASTSTAAGRGLLAGIDIGGTTTQAVLCDLDLRIIGRGEETTPARAGGSAMAETAIELVRALLTQTDAPLLGVGAGAAGVVDSSSGRILVASDSFVDWSGFPLGDVLASGLDVPAYIENDVNAFLRGEISAGAALGAHNALGITLGTGVGGALWLADRLWDGPSGGAGEIGHVPGFGTELCTCGGHGHLETVASGRGIERHYAGLLSGAFAPAEPATVALTARQIADRAHADGPDTAARATFERAANGLARGILITAGLLDVTTVVIGGGVSHAWPVLGPLVESALAAEPPVSGARLTVARSILGHDAVTLGAAAGARAALSA